MFEGKKYDIATIILLLFLLWKIPGQIISFFVVYPLSYLVLTLLFLALNIIAFIGIVLR